MTTHFRHAIATVALVTLGAGTAAAQAVIVQEPVESRTVVRESLNLSPAQRTTIYRTIVPQGRGKQPIVRERIVRESVGRSIPPRERVVIEPAERERILTEPTMRERIVVDPLARDRVVVAPTEVDYAVGDRVPSSVRLTAFPERIVREVPATRDYRYMVVNDRLLLVDPATSTVVEEIVRD
jgi:hypothetical protein